MAFSQRFGGQAPGGRPMNEEEVRRKEYEYEKARQETIARSKREAAKRATGGGGGFGPMGGGAGFGGGYGGGGENKFSWKKSTPAEASTGKGAGKGGKGAKADPKLEDMPSHDECEMAISAMISRSVNGMKEGLSALGLPNYPLEFVPGQTLKLCGHNLREEINEMIHAWMTDEKEDFYHCLSRIRGVVENPILTEEEIEMMENKEDWERSIGPDGKAMYTRRDPSAPKPKALAAPAAAPAAAAAAAPAGGLDDDDSDDEVIDVTPSGAPIAPAAKPAPAAAAPAADADEDYYDLLGVDAGANLQEIRAKFRALVVTHHPEKGGDPKFFAKLNKAYSVLSDQRKRQEYDQSRK